MYEIKPDVQKFATIKYGGEIIKIPVRSMGPGLGLRLSDLSDIQQKLAKQHAKIVSQILEFRAKGEQIPGDVSKKANEINAEIYRNQIILYKTCIVDYDKYESIIEKIPMIEAEHVKFFNEIVGAMMAGVEDEEEPVKKNGSRKSPKRKKK